MGIEKSKSEHDISQNSSLKALASPCKKQTYVCTMNATGVADNTANGFLTLFLLFCIPATTSAPPPDDSAERAVAAGCLRPSAYGFSS